MPAKMNPTTIGLLLVQAAAAVFGQANDCAGLATSLQIPDLEVLLSVPVAAGTNVSYPNDVPSCGRPNLTQRADTDVCRVLMLYTTGPTSNVTLEAWLPSDWSGRFLATGNGGTGGCIYYDELNYGASNGFASIGTNNGHDGVTGVFFLNNPGVIEDFIYRAIHSSAFIGKELIDTYYGRQPSKSYYLGCSTGGRQGFKEAQDFPEDFDGIVAGAPAFAWNDLNYQSGSAFVFTGPPNSSTFVTSRQWQLFNNATIAQCDTLDGVADGVLEDPDLCQIRPEALICGEGQSNSTDCLTPTQVQTVRNVYGAIYGPQGQLIYPRLQPGTTSPLVSGNPFAYSTDWFRYVIYNDTTWDPATLGLDDWERLTAQNPFNAQTFKGDLSGVRDRGVKILHYHGLQDGLISSDNSKRYYNEVQQTMGLTCDQLDEFYRYFRVSGMGHCGGGTGASNIGNGPDTSYGFEPSKNVLAAMVEWVENGVAPETIEGAKFSTGASSNGTQGVDYVRRHCRWPRRNVWDRTGDPKNEDSWSCQ
ncbi:Tannase and feruloyl esterase-like protein 1 [Elsinoe fawcettii]|nr:Tannase and feruloyl esterase-like protein 1 [Elsinoe fawcettii]